MTEKFQSSKRQIITVVMGQAGVPQANTMKAIAIGRRKCGYPVAAIEL
jgi:hypothetical protein